MYALHRTVVVPADGSARRQGHGLWIQDDGVTPSQVSHTFALDEAGIVRIALPPCPCRDVEGGCFRSSLNTTRFDPRTGSITADSDVACRCVYPPASRFMPVPDPADVDGEVYQPCATQGQTGWVSLVAGSLHAAGWDWNGACYGALSVYDAVSWSEPLVAGAATLDGRGMRVFGCSFEASPGDPPWPLASGLSCRGPELGHCDCSERYPESEVFVLRRGRLWRVEDSMSHADSIRWVSRRRVAPPSCPSINDPCGPPEAFAALRRRSRHTEYWVATDGTAALSGRGHDYRLHRSDGSEPDAFELPELHASSDVLGVRQHTDLGPLLAAMQRHPTLGGAPPGPPDARTCQPLVAAAEDEGFVDDRGGRGWGDRCLGHIRTERWDAAESACQHGLDMATEGQVRGALLYNLGRVAEGRGLVEAAVSLYRRSAEARPGNRAVDRRLRALAPRPTPR